MRTGKQSAHSTVLPQAVGNMATEVPERQLFIGGQWVAPSRGQYLDVIGPATESVVGKVPAATIEDVEKAVETANAAFKSGHWSKTSGVYRAKFLRAIAEKASLLFG